MRAKVGVYAYYWVYETEEFFNLGCLWKKYSSRCQFLAWKGVGKQFYEKYFQI